MSAFTIDNVTMMLPGLEIKTGCLSVQQGRIVSTGPSPSQQTLQRVFDGCGCLLTPGLIDIHTHGIGQYVYEASSDQLKEGLALLPQYGTTCVCPTFYRVMDRQSLHGLEALAAVLDEPLPVHVPGLHLEGPFLALPGAGALTVTGDVGLLKEILAAARNRVLAMSISPDTPGILPVIDYLVERGITPFITHTRADYQQTRDAINAGARHATHFYDVFHSPEATDGGVRPVGAVEAILEDPRCTVDFIADGVHVHPGAIRLAVRCKGYRGITMITDSNIGAGLGEGVFDTSWGFPVSVDPAQGVRNADPQHSSYGRLAGSALTMDQGINHLLHWLDLPEPKIWAMGTYNPASLLQLKNIGSLQIGNRADLVLWEKSEHGYRVVTTWVHGVVQWTSRNDLV